MIRTGRLRRTAMLLSLPLGTALLGAEGALRRLAGAEPDAVTQELRRRNATRTKRVLGDLKGGALKAGQLLSTVESLFPADPEATWRAALTALQDDNVGLPFAEVEPVLARELGPSWRADFATFDTAPSAAASIGQVHRATWRADGRDVAVKIQYPGVREAIATDMRVVSGVTRLVALVARGLAMPPLVAEMRTRLTEELDYVHEARAQSRFASAYADDIEVAVPAVVRATSRVLVQDWLAGTPLAQVAAGGTQAERDRAGELYQRFLLSGPARAGLLHTDPHPGNFRITADGRLGVLDFGSTLEMPGGMPATFGRLIAALLGDDPVEVLGRLTEEGFVRPGARLDVAKLVDFMSPFTVPAAHERFRFSREWLRGEFGRVNDPRNPEFSVAMQLSMPAEHLFTHRVWLGIVGVLCQLEAEVPIRAELERYLPGFTPPAPHPPGPAPPAHLPG
ncbi:MAG TPA: AarF/ABC1/UbiB kinase family protein [Mycobacteriales bacterium]|nr:AarF/ABC1/UbiB kinase family protein [Mycobacteriales bacterium]